MRGSSLVTSLLARGALLCALFLAVPAALPATQASSMGSVVRAASSATVWIWGYNGSGEIADGSTTNRLSPWRVPGLSGARAVTAGSSHVLAVTTDGSLWVWGNNGYGQLGLGPNSTGFGIPQQVAGLKSVRAVAAGDYFSLALATDGTVWAWGENQLGQLGIDPTASYRSVVPQRVAGLSGVKQIAAGAGFGLALKNDGTVWAWGDNGYGQLGVPQSAAYRRSLPQQVPGLPTARVVAAGDSFSLAVARDGSVWAWGNNEYGQLGEDDTITGSSVAKPLLVPGLSGVKALAAGAGHVLALAQNGTVWAWGNNRYGQLGISPEVANVYMRSSPQQVAGLSGVTAIAAGSSHSLALLANGSVWAWGDDEYGQLGDTTTNSRGSPQRVAGLGHVQSIGAAYGKSMAIVGPSASPAAPPPGGPTPSPHHVPLPPATGCAAITTATFGKCVEPSVLRVVKLLPGDLAEQGSAFVIRADATGTYLATNKHVVDGVTRDKLAVYLPDGRTRYSVVALLTTGADDGTTQDLAILLIQPTTLRPLQWGDSTRLTPLTPVVAVGYGDAFNLLGPPSVTRGEINATARDLGKCGGAGWIQHDASVTQGNSGGPLLDTRGLVVGINTLRLDEQTTCAMPGQFGFAIPSATAQVTLKTLARLMPGVQGGLVTMLGARSEIAASRVTSRTLSLPHLRVDLPVTWHRVGTTDVFGSRDGRLTITLSARRYTKAPTAAQLQADALRSLKPSAPFVGTGVSPLALQSLAGVVVSVIPAHHAYRGDGFALLDSSGRVEVVVTRLVDPKATLLDEQEADSLLFSLAAVD